jgi:hypothetical protein
VQYSIDILKSDAQGGDDDLDAVLAAFALEAKEVTKVVVENDTRPSPRSCACFVACTVQVAILAKARGYDPGTRAKIFA